MRRPSAGSSLPYLGHGVGLRVPHYEQALAGGLDVDWVELISENFFAGGGRPRALLERVRRDLPFVFHGVSLGVGSLGGPGPSYLSQLKQLVDRFEPAWLSDHLCWGHFEGRFSHDLLPLPYTEEALRHVVEQVLRVQDVLERRILLENVSSYVAFAHSQMHEWEFLSEVARRADCLILLDLNNILVSAHNHGFSPEQYLAGVPGERVQQLHLANHSTLPTHKFDDHRGPVPEEVWRLAEAAWHRFGPISSLIEWDEDVPSWQVLREQQCEAARRAARVLGEPSAARTPATLPAVAGVNPVGSAGLAPGSAGLAPGSAALAPGSAALAPGSAAAAPGLREVQELFFAAICWPTGVAGFLAQASVEVRRALPQLCVGRAGWDGMQRLEVYADSYFYRLRGALRELFPRLCFVSGDVEFHNLVTDYVLACPSEQPDLRQLGERLPEFVREHPLGLRSAVLAPLALLERALNAALDAPDGPLLSEDELRAIPLARWSDLRFVFSAPTACLRVRWDLERLERAYRSGQRDEALALVPTSEPCTLIVGRRGHATYFRAAGAAEALVLARLWSGETFGAACTVLERAGSEPAELVGALRRWLEDGMIAGLSEKTALDVGPGLG
ncbi:MAG: DUF692 family multinuclear iron-containing protein [Deltaproteobacteria bacterium]